MSPKIEQAALGTAGILASLLFVATTVNGVQAHGVHNGRDRTCETAECSETDNLLSGFGQLKSCPQTTVFCA